MLVTGTQRQCDDRIPTRIDALLKLNPHNKSLEPSPWLVHDSVGFCLLWFYKYDAAGRLNSMLG
jgi:hypothetical protein